MNELKNIKYNRIQSNIKRYLYTLHVDKYAAYDVYYNTLGDNIIVVDRNAILISINTKFIPKEIGVEAFSTYLLEKLNCDDYDYEINNVNP